MTVPSRPQPVQLFIGVLASSEGLRSTVRDRVAESFGPIDFESDAFRFDVTDYYEPEMGPGLLRWFVSFERLIPPEDLVPVKLATNRLEDDLRKDGRRRVNLDPGYMDVYKIVLASAKFQGPKIHLGQGIYADPALCYDKGWKAFPWGFPDFRDGRYDAVFTKIRRLYKDKRRVQNGTG